MVLLGANGAGKSSIFLTISGLNRTAAAASACGHELSGPEAVAIVHRRRGALPGRAQAVSRHVGVEEPALGAYVHRATSAGVSRTLEEVFALFPILHEKKTGRGLAFRRPAADGGDRARADGRPQALLLDEPSLGLAPLVVKQVFGVIEKINRAGTTVLLAEQNAYAALNSPAAPM